MYSIVIAGFFAVIVIVADDFITATVAVAIGVTDVASIAVVAAAVAVTASTVVLEARAGSKDLEIVLYLVFGDAVVFLSVKLIVTCLVVVASKTMQNKLAYAL